MSDLADRLSYAAALAIGPPDRYGLEGRAAAAAVVRELASTTTTPDLTTLGELIVELEEQ